MDGMRTARKEAGKSSEEHRLGACVVKSGRCLGKGYNQFNKINSLVRKYFDFPTLHAEAAAMCRIDPEDAKGSIVYVYRLRRTRHCGPGLARPCEKCAKMLAEYGVKRVVYSTDVDPFYEIVEVDEL